VFEFRISAKKRKWETQQTRLLPGNKLAAEGGQARKTRLPPPKSRWAVAAGRGGAGRSRGDTRRPGMSRKTNLGAYQARPGPRKTTQVPACVVAPAPPDIGPLEGRDGIRFPAIPGTVGKGKKTGVGKSSRVATGGKGIAGGMVGNPQFFSVPFVPGPGGGGGGVPDLRGALWAHFRA